jgi:hypothetical protein
MVDSNETLNVAVNTIHNIKEEHREVSAEWKHTGCDNHPMHLQIQQNLSLLSQGLNNIKGRSASLYEELQNEINLVSFVREKTFRE